MEIDAVMDGYIKINHHSATSISRMLNFELAFLIQGVHSSYHQELITITNKLTECFPGKGGAQEEACQLRHMYTAWADEIMAVMESIADKTDKVDHKLFIRWKKGEFMENARAPMRVKDIRELTETIPATRALLVKPVDRLRLYIDN